LLKLEWIPLSKTNVNREKLLKSKILVEPLLSKIPGSAPALDNDEASNIYKRV
jgi:hypothetical protein